MPNTPVTWRNSQTVNTVTAGGQIDPDIIQLANGNILVSWTSFDNTGAGASAGLDVIGQLYDPLGNRIGGEFQLNNVFSADDEQDMDLAALPGGGFISVFEDTDADVTSIRLNEYDAAGSQVSAGVTVVSDGVTADPNYRNPVVAVSSATSALIVYEVVTDGESNTFGTIYNSTTNSYGTPFWIMIGYSGVSDADVAVLTNGNYVVTGVGGDIDRFVLYQIVNSAGTILLDDNLVMDTYSNAEDDREAAVTALTGGGFVIAYTHTDSSDTDLNFSVYNAAGAQTGDGAVAVGSSTNDNNESKVIALADGSFVIAYDNDEIFGVNVEHFSATGAVLGVPFIVSAVNADSVSGVGLDDGRFALVWDVSGGEIQMEILDTRNAVNNPGVYTGDEWQTGTVGNDVFTADNLTDIVHGWDGNDTITEGSGSDQIFGDAGTDTIIVASSIGSDVWDGGSGTDTITWTFAGETGATFDLLAGTATDTSLNVEQMLNFENLNGTANRDIVLGTNGVNILQGQGGDDDLFGLNGADELYGGNGLDYLSGGAQADYLSGGAEKDVFFGGGGIDTLVGGGGDDEFYISSTDLSDIINEVAGGGNDRIFASVSYALAATSEVETIGTDSNAGVGAINLTGSDLANTVVGNNGTNILDGRGGNDVLYGLGGVDYFSFSSIPNGATNMDTIADFVSADDLFFIDDAAFTGMAAGSLAATGFLSGAGLTSAATAAQRVIHNSTTGDLYYDQDGAGGLASVRFANIGAGTAVFNYDFFGI